MAQRFNVSIPDELDAGIEPYKHKLYPFRGRDGLWRTLSLLNP